MELNLANSFDTTNALSGIYLWLIFGLVVAHVNCDVRRFMDGNGLLRHLITLLAFFFLFTIVDGNNKSDLLTTWVKTLIIYVLFVLMTKSKWYFVIPVIALLLADQSLKRHLGFKKNNGHVEEQEEKRILKASEVINWVVVGVIIVGCVHYMYLQYTEYGKDFSFALFFLGTDKCKKVAPSYNLLRKQSK